MDPAEGGHHETFQGIEMAEIAIASQPASGRTAGVRGGARKLTAEIDLVAKRRSKTAREQESLADILIRQTQEHPARTVAIAIGVGYVLGGGLFSRLTGRILGTGIRIGLRTALLPFVTESLVALGQRTPLRGRRET